MVKAASELPLLPLLLLQHLLLLLALLLPPATAIAAATANAASTATAITPLLIYVFLPSPILLPCGFSPAFPLLLPIFSLLLLLAAAA